MSAYVYYSYEEWGRGYIGARSRSWEGDNNYLGTFTDRTFAPTEKIILAEFETMAEALEAECALHEFYDIARNPHFANRACQTSTGFTRSGRKDSPETIEKKRIAHIGKVHSPDVLKRMIESRRKGARWGPVNEATRAALLKAAKCKKSIAHKERIKMANARTKRKSWKKEWWDAVEAALETAGGRRLWGKQKILSSHDVSERTLRRMKKLIQAGFTFEDAKAGLG